MNKLNKIFIHKYKLPGKAIEYNSKTQKVVVEYEKRQGKHTHLVKEEFDRSEISHFKPKRKKQTRKPLQIKIKYFDESLPKLEKIKIGDWVDLRAAKTVEMNKYDFEIIPLGIAMQLPKGFEANIVPRSSTFKKWGILQTNSYGVIDETYCGDNDQWGFPALAMKHTVIEKGERICQFRVNRTMPGVEFIEVKELGNPDRQGFGSTGSK